MEGRASASTNRFVELGTRARTLRKEKGLSLEQMAAKSGVALATLSRMENGKGSGTLRTHQKIAEALGLSLSELYRNVQAEAPDAQLLQPHSDEVETFTYDEKAAAVFLAKGISGKQMFPQMIVLQPQGRTTLERYSTGTERWIFGLEGAVEITVDSKTYKLSEGGTLYLKASLPHRMENRSGRTARVISVTSPVAF